MIYNTYSKNLNVKKIDYLLQNLAKLSQKNQIEELQQPKFYLITLNCQQQRMHKFGNYGKKRKRILLKIFAIL